MTLTYTLLSTTTLGSDASTITINSISQSYRDLVVVVRAKASTTSELRFSLNPSNNEHRYTSIIALSGNTTSQSSSGQAGFQANANLSTAEETFAIMNLMDYSKTNRQTTGFIEFKEPTTRLALMGLRWTDTTAVTSISISASSGNLRANSSVRIYGIVG